MRQSGYLLLAVLLLMALMIIAATIEAPVLVQQLKRDREEEMIHRGTEYARAVRKFYKKFGRYPATLEQLENTNQMRFLRKRYNDPLTKDGKWKLLTYTDLLTLLNPAATATTTATQGTQGQNALGQPSAVTSVGTSGLGSQSSTLGTGNVTYGSTTGFDQGTSTVQQQQQQQQQQTGIGGNTQQGTNPFANTFSLGSTGASGQQGSQPGVLATNVAGGNPTLGGGPIVGVASLSKDPTIRIYNKKKTYNEWIFIYNPMMDQVNVLLRGPYQATTVGGAQIGIPAGQLNQSQTGQQQNTFGQPSSSFGQSSTGFGQQNSPQQSFPPDQNQQH